MTELKNSHRPKLTRTCLFCLTCFGDNEGTMYSAVTLMLTSRAAMKTGGQQGLNWTTEDKRTPTLGIRLASDLQLGTEIISSTFRLLRAFLVFSPVPYNSSLWDIAKGLMEIIKMYDGIFKSHQMAQEANFLRPGIILVIFIRSAAFFTEVCPRKKSSRCKCPCHSNSVALLQITVILFL